MARHTEQRTSIRAAIESAARPLSVQEVLEAARRTVPTLGQATVYRALKQGLREGWLVQIDVPGGPARYEASGKHHHHHFHCRRCGRMFEVPGCRLKQPVRLPDGFRVEGHEMLLHGRCRECR
ncbi:MAG: transcriptional repressor [Acidobacteriota bacterium]|jgi:Fur family ferric uptake transcriptional regulator